MRTYVNSWWISKTRLPYAGEESFEPNLCAFCSVIPSGSFKSEDTYSNSRNFSLGWLCSGACGRRVSSEAVCVIVDQHQQDSGDNGPVLMGLRKTFLTNGPLDYIPAHEMKQIDNGQMSVANYYGHLPKTDMAHIVWNGQDGHSYIRHTILISQ